jgi:hypothetical protein
MQAELFKARAAFSSSAHVRYLLRRKKASASRGEWFQHPTSWKVLFALPRTSQSDCMAYENNDLGAVEPTRSRSGLEKLEMLSDAQMTVCQWEG